ncbi:MAG: type II secretion system protein [Bradyrhizobium sp.]
MKRSPRRLSRDVANRRDRERGFALLEILVAFIILALGLGAVLIGVSGAMRADTRTQTNRGALRVAQSRLEAVGTSEVLVPGQREGRAGDKYTWRQTITAVQSGVGSQDKAAKPEAAAVSSVAAFWVEVAVQAGDGSTASLAALKLAPVAKP